MVKREIKSFEIQVNGMGLSTEVPMTLSSVLKRHGFERSSEKGEYDELPAEELAPSSSEISGVIDFYSEFPVDVATAESKQVYIKLRNIRQPAAVYVNGELVGELDGEAPCAYFDLSGKIFAGSNELSIKFEAEECSHLGLVGLFYPPEIIRFAGAVIDRIHVNQKHEDGAVKLFVRADTIGSTENVRAVATLTSPSGQLYYAGFTKGEGIITVTDPLFWQPRGYGVQNLYKLTVNLYGESDVEDSYEIKIGLRTIAKTETASLLVNGIRFLPMGATYVADEQPDPKDYVKKEEAYVTYAAMAGYNAFVLPPLALRPSDRFLELCDIHGILVIEESPSLSAGSLDAIERRSHHACYALLDVVGLDDKEYASECLSRLMPNLAVSFVDETPEYISAPSLPSDKSLDEVVPDDERNLFSRSVERIASRDSISQMLLSVAEKYPYPATLSDFAYASGLAAAAKVFEVVKQSRMTLGASGRAVFSRLGDTDVIVSSSAMDSFTRWKPLQYRAARYFAPVTIYADNTPGGVLFSVSNERRLDVIGSIEYRVANSHNETIYRGSEPCEISALSSRSLFTRDFSEHISGRERSCYLEYCLKEGAAVLSRGTLLFCPEKHFVFCDPKIKVEITGSDRRFNLTLSASAFAKDVEIDFAGIDMLISDNYIDLTGDAPVKISLTSLSGTQTVYHLENALRIRSMYDLKL